jgi:hypothetical protein
MISAVTLKAITTAAYSSEAGTPHIAVIGLLPLRVRQRIGAVRS